LRAYYERLEPISATAGVQKALKLPLVFEGGFRYLQPADARPALLWRRPA
jgi:hypothetical protein